MIGGRAVLGAGCVAMLAAGCDYIFRLDPIGPPDASRDGPSPNPDVRVADDAAPPLCAAPVLRDLFDGPDICTPWGTSYMDLGATIKEAGMLVMTPAAQVDSVAGCLTSGSSQPFGSGVSAIVTDIVRGTGAYTVLQIHGPELQIKAVAGVVLQFETSGGQAIGTPVSYAPAMKWWRIKPVQGAIVGEFSTDGKTWTTLGTSVQVPPATVGIELTGGTSSTTVSGAASFDELVICP